MELIDYVYVVKSVTNSVNLFKTKTRKTLILRVLGFKDVVPLGIEPRTHGFSVRCSTY
jgi:hypothetical protein